MSVEELNMSITNHFKVLRDKKFLTEAFLFLYFQIESLTKENLENNINLEKYLLTLKKIKNIFEKPKSKVKDWESTQNSLFKLRINTQIQNIVKNSLKNSSKISERNLNVAEVRKMFTYHKYNDAVTIVDSILASKNGTARYLRNRLVHSGETITEEEFEKFETDMILLLNYLQDLKIIILSAWEK